MALNSIDSSFVQYHKRYLERCKYHNDDEGIGSAYEALARSFERYVYMYVHNIHVLVPYVVHVHVPVHICMRYICK